MALNFTKGSGSLAITDYRALIKDIRQIKPTLLKQMRKDARIIARPLQSSIKNAIPTVRPLSGMVTKVGRLSWTPTMNTVNPLKSVLVDAYKNPGSNFMYYGIVKLKVRNAAVVMSDMMGRSGAYVNSRPRTREYDYTYHRGGQEIIGKRSHKINGQGAAMISKLNGHFGKGGSRMVYPAVESGGLPQAKMEIRSSLQKAYTELNVLMLRESK